MCDLIDRQAAIDAFEDTTFTKNEIRRRLSEVPPAFGTIKHAGAENPLSDEEIIPRLREIREQVGGSYAIDRAIELLTAQPEQHIDEWCTDCKEYDKEKRSCPRWNRVIRQTLADAQPEQHNLSEAYANAVFTWLMSYQIQSAQLKGRYTPYEVIGWVLNDWRKEHDAERDT